MATQEVIQTIRQNSPYSSDGSLNGERTVDLNGSDLRFRDNSGTEVNILTSLGTLEFITPGPNMTISQDEDFIKIKYNGATKILLGEGSNKIDYTADNHNFLGDVNINGDPVLSSVPTLNQVLTVDSDGGANGMSNITAISMSSGLTNFLYMHSPDGTPWIVTIANDGTLSIVADV